MKKTIKLTESDMFRIVKRIISEQTVPTLRGSNNPIGMSQRDIDMKMKLRNIKSEMRSLLDYNETDPNEIARRCDRMVELCNKMKSMVQR